MSNRWLITADEERALRGMSHECRTLYVFEIRRHMDYATGIVGIQRRISIQQFREALYVEGRTSCKPIEYTRFQVHRFVQQLEKQGLLERLEPGKLIFKLPLAGIGEIRPKKSRTEAARSAAQSIHKLTDCNNEENEHSEEAKPHGKFSKSRTSSGTGNIYKKGDENNLSTQPLTNAQKFQQRWKTPIPESFKPSPKFIDLAQEKEWPDPLGDALDAFKTKHQGEGTLALDWEKLYESFLINRKTFLTKKSGGGAKFNYGSFKAPDEALRDMYNKYREKDELSSKAYKIACDKAGGSYNLKLMKEKDALKLFTPIYQKLIKEQFH